ncbi:hypothetical protein XA68_15686 [Ophiocordyceps unilateralis]|uniref:LysM domain-containing protein n=1 Tax=Ophiocordyceps unilateralis TaxID=268505 RepID=A0A2A9P805_OPHUN|nr:hypothetical protein XA68_15686 [Ophiocordyceps unilateralis]
MASMKHCIFLVGSAQLLLGALVNAHLVPRATRSLADANVAAPVETTNFAAGPGASQEGKSGPSLGGEGESGASRGGNQKLCPYQVKLEEHCWGIKTDFNITLDQFYEFNPEVNGDAKNCDLAVGQTLQLPCIDASPARQPVVSQDAPCTDTFKTEEAGTCRSIVLNKFISFRNLKDWNPQLQANEAGECDIPAGTEVCISKSEKKITCTKEYSAKSDDVCHEIAAAQGITVNLLSGMNPNIIDNYCLIHPNQKLCVAAEGFSTEKTAATGNATQPLRAEDGQEAGQGAGDKSGQQETVSIVKAIEQFVAPFAGNVTDPNANPDPKLLEPIKQKVEQFMKSGSTKSSPDDSGLVKSVELGLKEEGMAGAAGNTKRSFAWTLF